MAGVEIRNMDAPDETTRTPDKALVQIVKLAGDTGVGRATFQPGWKWSESIKPVVGTDSCHVHSTSVETFAKE